jgi:DNA invertase Pin-like site-specific DNA recombinase
MATKELASMQDETTHPEPAEDERRRAIAYLRVSTNTQAEDGLGLDVQRDKLHEHAVEKNLQLIEVVEEVASGGLSNGETFSWEHRPVLLSLLERAKQGDYDILLVARLDRLSRDHVTLVAIERQLQARGVEVVSAAEEHNGDGPLAEFVRGQLGLIAEYERALIRERLAAGKARARQEGKHAEGKPPYGYRSDKGVLTPILDQAEIVKRIYREAKDGRTPGKIAKRLNDDGIPSARGSVWRSNSVRIVLTNAAYYGERHGIRKVHAPIISRRLFNQAQHVIQSRRRT